MGRNKVVEAKRKINVIYVSIDQYKKMMIMVMQESMWVCYDRTRKRT